MGLPYALTQFTSPIVDTALKTGGRGETTTLTDYGVIGDAFFKKAQLDLGIAELKGNMAMKSAELQSNLEMDKARLNTSMLQSRMDYDVNLRQLKMELEKNESSVFESVMTGLAGAAMAASIPLTMGASTPVVIGAAAGGGLLAGMSAAKGGRQAGQSSLNMLNSASVLATSFKQVQGEKVGKDSLNTVLTEGAKWANIINSPGASAGERANAQQQLNQLMANQANAQIQKGVNPEIAFNSVNGMGQLLMGNGSGSSSRTRGGGFDANDSWEVRNDAIFNKALASGQLDDPKTAGQAREKLMNDLRVNYATSFSKPGGEAALIPNSLLYSLVEKSGINEKPGLMALDSPSGSGVAADGGPVTSRTPQQRRRGASRGPSQVQSGGPLVNPRQGQPIQQDAPSFSNPIPQQAARPAQPMLRKSLEMDDGGPPPAAQQEMELAKQGEESVKTLQKMKKEMPDERSVLDKFNDKTSLGIFKESDYKNRQQELDARIEDTEKYVAERKGKAQEISNRAIKIDPKDKEQALAPLPGKTQPEANFNTAREPAGELFDMLENGELPTTPNNASSYEAYKQGIEAGGTFQGVSIPKVKLQKKGEIKKSGPMNIPDNLLGANKWDGDPEEVVAAYSKAEKLVEQIATEAIPIKQKGSTNPITMEELKKEISSILFSGAPPKQVARDLTTYMKGLRRSAATAEPLHDREKRELQTQNLRLEGQNKSLESSAKRLSIQEKEEEEAETMPMGWTMLKRRYGGR